MESQKGDSSEICPELLLEIVDRLGEDPRSMLPIIDDFLSPDSFETSLVSLISFLTDTGSLLSKKFQRLHGEVVISSQPQPLLLRHLIRSCQPRLMWMDEGGMLASVVGCYVVSEK